MARTPIDLNWTDLIEKGPPAELEIIPSSSSSDRDNVEHFSDHQLDEKIQRMQLNKAAFAARLSDGGAKYMANLNQLVAERDRRMKMKQLQKLDEKIQRMQLNKAAFAARLSDGGAKYMANLNQLVAERDRRLKMKQLPKGPLAELEIIPSSSSSDRDNVEHFSDHQLDEKIQRMQLNKAAFAARLSDGGAKYMANLNQLVAERDRRMKMKQLQKGLPAELEIIPSSSSSDRDNVEHFFDHQLDEKIQRMQLNKAAFAARLSDGGAKYMANLNQLVAERDRRMKMKQLQKDADELQKPIHSKSSCVSGASNVINEKPPMSNAHSQSFAERFSKRIGDKTGGCTPNALNENPRCFSENMFYNSKSKGQLRSLGRQGTSSERQGTVVSSRPEPLQCPSSLSAKGEKGGPLSHNHKGISPTSHSPLHLEENLSRHFSNKRASFPTPTCLTMKSRKVQTLVVLDEEEVHPMHPEQSVHQEDKAEERTEDIKIYYPSRDDPECIDLCGADLECLNPECPLSSTIMNFYIRYLQRPISPTGKPRADYHFFNTYFYKKLEDAISCKMRDKDTFYPKFRRWWKGINIFQKSYIFLPIHADEHWSLVIICMPPKDEDTGLLVLHLDSLGYHASSQIFDNIERYLREEWNYLKQNADSQHVPISKKIWNKLSRRISWEVIAVPQQKNDYDCGLFVLYFIERFIEEAPERLRRKDLSMFGRNWFKSEEASKLRERIRCLLTEQFESARLNNNSTTSSSDG